MRSHLAKMGMTLKIMSRNENVQEIERYTRTVKERVRSIANTLPFKKTPKIIVEIVYNVVFRLNNFPHTDGIHAT